MEITPLHDRIIVRREHEEGEQRVGGIIVPDSAKEKPHRGTVIAVGKGRLTDEGTRIPLDVKIGDLVLFGKYTSTDITLHGEDLLVLRENEVLAVIDGSGPGRTQS